MPSRRADFVIKSRCVVTPQGVRDAAVVVSAGKIAEVLPAAARLLPSFVLPAGDSIMDVGDSALLPGLVDTHAHINDPGRTEWEGFETATAAAAAGGITSIVDMPLNSIPPTTSLRGLEVKRERAEGRCGVDVGFWGGVVPGNAGELEPMAEAGALGFKAFLIGSGVPQFPAVGEPELRRAMPILARLGLPLLAHAELCAAPAPCPSSRRYADYLASRPGAWEVSAIRLLIRLCRETGCRVHIVHLSCADALEDLAAARRDSLPITVETCPHYLALDAESIPDGATQYKCAPPIRGRENRERLWRALEEGTIDFIVSDHSPCSPELKSLERGDFAAAWGGIASIQFSLPVAWTEMRGRRRSLSDLARWMAQAPAAFAGLEAKGAIEPGRDADLVVFDPDAEFSVSRDKIFQRHHLTPYEGRTLRGRAEAVFLRGEKIYDQGKFLGGLSGRLLRAAARPPSPRTARS